MQGFSRVIGLLWLLTPMPLTAQLQAESFDFWLGDWELTWFSPDGDTLKGSNSITKILSDQVIHEQFSSFRNGFQGESWSVYSEKTGRWQQTWVDNQGGYLCFEGAAQGDSLLFIRTPQESEDKQVIKRMVFHQIKPNSFTWDWQQQVDGAAWQNLWRIHYKRKKQP